jgi:hypothetical protein
MKENLDNVAFVHGRRQAKDEQSGRSISVVDLTVQSEAPLLGLIVL